MLYCFIYFFFFNDTATTEIYTTVHTLSLHDALPILEEHPEDIRLRELGHLQRGQRSEEHTSELQSRTVISYAVFCLKKKKKKTKKKKVTLILKKKNQKKKQKKQKK